MAPSKLVLSTRNRHKLREFARLLEPAGVALDPLPDQLELPPEDGETFADNALGKARAAAAGTGRVAIADDSGIEAEALGGAPGVRSARYAGERASDEENLSKLVREAAAGSGLRYVCALAYVDPATGFERVFHGDCRGRMASSPRGTRRLRLRPRLLARRPRGRRRPDYGRAERRREGSDQPSRPRRPSADGMASRMTAEPRLKERTAVISVASNSSLILVKIVAGTITGSVAILTEAVHSSIDLVASVVALLSVRKAGEPADESHRYGHEKIENLAAAIEGILILVGSAAIAFQAIRHLLQHGRVQKIGLGIAVVAGSMVVNVIVSWFIARGARATDSPALAGDAAHLRTDALSSAAVLIALVLVDVTGAQWLDPAVALAVAAAIVVTGVRLLLRSSRVLVDEALPADEVGEIRQRDRGVRPARRGRIPRVAHAAGGFAPVRRPPCPVPPWTSLEDAHRTAHELQDRIGTRLRGADVLIHLEPEDRVRPGETLEPEPAGPVEHTRPARS